MNPQTPPIRVLIVEDEPRIAQAHRSYVERVPGFAVVGVVHTGREAIRVATRAAERTDGPARPGERRSREPIDLVLMDIGLPDIGGLEVTAALTRLRPRPDVIAISSARDLDMVRAAVSHGVALYLLKPFPFAAFRDKLERYLEFRAALPDSAASSLTQHDIDRAFSALRTPDPRAVSPKGIAPQTLEEISRVLRAAPGGLSATETGRSAGVSRVTAWRYLEQLAAEGVVERRTDYGRAGRPQVRYIWRR
ncbi:response regulator [Nocardia sp. NEAU-G5]|uniref:Transcriptional regulatory protein n=1 Tax=Nocardia albiluteola TaxID=2842303 RepID=A0ABS6AZH0_9NOCA|nr:response regulator [Nocardia albiluteola]MBU3063452.1 response regulator [Nocardia albiluteola]